MMSSSPHCGHGVAGNSAPSIQNAGHSPWPAASWIRASTRPEIERYGKWVFDQPFFLIFNLAVGGQFDGDPKSDAPFPATMLVDWVRVYR
jgi:hypothetical protein